MDGFPDEDGQHVDEHEPRPHQSPASLLCFELSALLRLQHQSLNS